MCRGLFLAGNAGLSSASRQLTAARGALPETPSSPYGSGVGRLAQLEEHLVYTERVGGSRPSPPTISSKSLFGRQGFLRHTKWKLRHRQARHCARNIFDLAISDR